MSKTEARSRISGSKMASKVLRSLEASLCFVVLEPRCYARREDDDQ
jgi:hypothetical protein